MRLSFHDNDTAAKNVISKEQKRLTAYRAKVAEICAAQDNSRSEYSLAYVTNQNIQNELTALKKHFSKTKHLVVIGIGGSSLGLEAIHQVLDNGAVKLSVLDTISAHDVEQLLSALSNLKRVDQLAICIISKSGSTTETLTNAGVLLDNLKKKWGDSLYKQTIFIGDAGTEFLKFGKRLGAIVMPMPTNIGGRYSVATEVGLVPLTILGHDVGAFIEGFAAGNMPEFEGISAESAARIYTYIQKDFRHYNFFAFEKRLEKLGAWYRQLFAESIGKSVTKSNKPLSKGMVPTISTPVELHSIGQLYLSGFKGVYTDFVSFDDVAVDFQIPKNGLAKAFGRFTMQEVATALYGGVAGAYNEKKLPYRTTIFEDDLAYSLGLFMSMRMREVMYLAELMNIDAFNQPNVELYKQKTKNILGL